MAGLAHAGAALAVRGRLLPARDAAALDAERRPRAAALVRVRRNARGARRAAVLGRQPRARRRPCRARHPARGIFLRTGVRLRHPHRASRPLQRGECRMSEKLYVSAESLLRDSMELAMRIVRSGFRPTFLVALWRGGAPIGITVQEVLEYHGIQADHIAIRTSSYTGIDQQAKVVRVHAMNYLISRLSFEDQLLIIDDVFDSGRSLEAVMAELKRRCRRNLAEEIRIATVYYKPERN